MLTLKRFQLRRQKHQQQQQQQHQLQIDALNVDDRLRRRNSAPFVTDKTRSPIATRNEASQQQPRQIMAAKPALEKHRSSPLIKVEGVEDIPPPRSRFGDHLTAGRNSRSSSSADSESILHFAVSHEDVDTTRRLLGQGGVDVNNMRPPGVAPLHEACALGNLELVQLLLQYDADMDLTTWQGLSPLKIAASRGNFEVAEFLVAAGAEANDIKDGFQNNHVTKKRLSRKKPQ